MDNKEKTIKIFPKVAEKFVPNNKTFEMLFPYLGEGDSLLDVGCRYGELKCFLDKKKKNVRYFGIDPQLDHYSSALLYAPTKDKIIKTDIESFKTNQKFDKIVLSHVLEHVKSPCMTLEKCKSMLKPNGKILIVVPNIYTFKFLCVIPFNLKNYPAEMTRIFRNLPKWK